MITFKKIEKNDSAISELAKLASEIWHEYWVCVISKEQINYMLEKFQSETAIKKQMESENYVYFYVLSAGKISGYIGMSKKEEYLFLSKLYIKKDLRHKGIGSRSFKFIKDFARENNYRKITLTVNKNNKNTICAYNKWGFKTTNSVVTDIGSGFVMDDYIMEYVL